MTFQIVRIISKGARVVNGRKVDTIQAIVRFPDGDTTRHLIQQPNGSWTGWNSDRTLRERQRILDSYKAHEATLMAAETRVGDTENTLTGLKGKRGAEATANRKRLRETAKVAEATLTTANADLAKIKTIADQVERTHPKIVKFE